MNAPTGPASGPAQPAPDVAWFSLSPDEAAKAPAGTTSRSRRTSTATSKTRTRASAKAAADLGKRETEVVINGRG